MYCIISMFDMTVKLFGFIFEFFRFLLVLFTGEKGGIHV
jgi:hypothetical protein